ncbi:hypothetical protein CsSME_00004771 [Camellia sinensis var. sinensis]
MLILGGIDPPIRFCAASKTVNYMQSRSNFGYSAPDIWLALKLAEKLCRSPRRDPLNILLFTNNLYEVLPMVSKNLFVNEKKDREPEKPF